MCCGRDYVKTRHSPMHLKIQKKCTEIERGVSTFQVKQFGKMIQLKNKVNSLLDGHLSDVRLIESNKWSKERQGPTPRVRFTTEVSVNERELTDCATNLSVCASKISNKVK